MLVSTDIGSSPPIVASGSRYPSLAITGCLAATLLVSSLADRRRPDSLAKPIESIDVAIGGWTLAEQQVLPASILDKLRASSYISRIYQRRDRQLGLFIAYYPQQRAGESMHSPRVCLPGSGWDIVGRSTAAVRFGGKDLELNQYQVQNSGKHMLVFYWYQSRNRIIANEYLGKVFLVKDAIFTGYTPGSIVRILLPDDEAAVQEGLAFARDLIPQVQRCFGN